MFSASDLFVANLAGHLDAFARISLVPEIDQKQRQTEIVKKNRNPKFASNKFKFPIAYEELNDHQLFVDLMDHSRITRSHRLGIAMIDFQTIDISSEIELWVQLQTKKEVKNQQKT